MQKFILILVITFFIQSLSASKWMYNKTLHKIKFSRVKYETSHNDTLYIYGKLERPTLISGIPCSADWVKLSKDFRLKEFCLEKNFIINNLQFPKHTWIFFGKSEIRCVLPNDDFFQGYLCKGGGGKSGVRTSFYKNGNLKSFFSPKDIEISEIPCKGGIFHYIELFENGNLKNCTLSKPIKLNGKKYKKGEKISFEK